MGLHRAGIVLSVVGLVHISAGFYLPGLAPQNYCEKGGIPDCRNKVNVYVNRLVSLKSIFPYDYNTFGFCGLPDGRRKVSENIGQVLFGERIHPSPYQFTFGKNETCRPVCDTIHTGSDASLKFLKEGIRNVYNHHWIVDNMPVVWCYLTTTEWQYCSDGFPIGCFTGDGSFLAEGCANPDRFSEPESYYLFNHVDITVEYHNGKGKDWVGGRVVKVVVKPKSFGSSNCEGEALTLPKGANESMHIAYTYSVTFAVNNNIEWVSRWDSLLNNSRNYRIQWFSFMNSTIVILFLLGLIIIIFFRSIRKARLEKSDAMDEMHEWRAIHGDVFRPPKKGLLLAVLNGTGTQILWTTILTLIFASFGFLSPANRGALGTTAIVFYEMLFAPVSGYKSSRLIKSFQKDQWKMAAMLCSFLIPGLLFSIFMILNLVNWVAGSSAAVPFTTVLLLVGIHFGISAPLTFAGAYLGQRREAAQPPVSITPAARMVPPQRCYKHPLFCLLIGGVLPFGCMFVQLFFVLNAIWGHQVYYMFGLLLLTAVVLTITCAESAILLCYFHLVSEDYRWWWRSFLTSGFTAMYFCLYCIQFYATRLQLSGAADALMYAGYTLIMAIVLFLFCGTVGFTACHWFVSKLYGAWKAGQQHSIEFVERKKSNLEKKIVRKCEIGDSENLVIVQTMQKEDRL